MNLRMTSLSFLGKDISFYEGSFSELLSYCMFCEKYIVIFFLIIHQF